MCDTRLCMSCRVTVSFDVAGVKDAREAKLRSIPCGTYRGIRHGAGLMVAWAATGSNAGHFIWGTQGHHQRKGSQPPEPAVLCCQ